MLRRLLTFAIAVLSLPAAAAAQGRFELTPTASYNFGGTIDAGDSDLFDFDLESEDSEAYGITFDIPVASWAQIELLASRQSSPALHLMPAIPPHIVPGSPIFDEAFTF